MKETAAVYRAWPEKRQEVMKAGRESGQMTQSGHHTSDFSFKISFYHLKMDASSASYSQTCLFLQQQDPLPTIEWLRLQKNTPVYPVTLGPSRKTWKAYVPQIKKPRGRAPAPTAFL